MIIQCCICNKIIGEKEPIKNKGVTSSYCDYCYKIINKDLEEGNVNAGSRTS